jgi:hypothetical protein
VYCDVNPQAKPRGIYPGFTGAFGELDEVECPDGFVPKGVAVNLQAQLQIERKNNTRLQQRCDDMRERMNSLHSKLRNNARDRSTAQKRGGISQIDLCVRFNEPPANLHRKVKPRGMTAQEYLHEKTGWHFEPESRLWFPPGGPLELPDEGIPDPDMEFIALKNQRKENKIAAQQKGGITQSELCIRFSESISSVSLHAKSRGMTIKEYLHQKTGWHFEPESNLWLPPDDSDGCPEHSASSKSVSLPTLYQQDRIAARQRGGLTQQELCSRFGEDSCSLGARAKPREITIKEYLHRRTGWNFEPESKLWFPPDESEESPALLPLFLGHMKIAGKQKGGLTQRELCQRFSENSSGISFKAKQKGMTIPEYLHQATGWHFEPEFKLWFPPDESEEGSPPLAHLLGCHKIALKQKGGFTQKELCQCFSENPGGISQRAKRKDLTIKDYLRQKTGWHFEPESKLWLPPDESKEGSPPLAKLLGCNKIAIKERGGLTRQELCARFNENSKNVSTKARTRGLTTEEYLHQKTGWHLEPIFKLWLPPDVVEDCPDEQSEEPEVP